MIYCLYDGIYIIPLCLLLETYGRRLGLLPEKGGAMFILSVLVMAIAMAIRYTRGRVRLILATVTVFVTALWSAFQVGRQREQVGQTLFGMGAVALVTVGCALLAFSMKNSLTWRIMIALIAVLLVAGLVFQIPLPKKIFAIAILPLLAAMVEEVQYHWKKEEEIDHRKHLVTIAPFLFIICLGVFAFPTAKEPFDWSFTVRIWERTADLMTRWQNRLTGNDDYEGQIGFSEEASFASKLSDEDPKDVMEVTFGRNAGSVVYLRGKTFDRFTGRGWKSTVKGNQTLRDEEYDEVVRNINMQAGVDRNRYIRRVELGIRYLDFRTKYIFAPLNTNVNHIRIKGERVKEEGDDLHASSQLGYDTMYDILYYRLNQDHEDFRKFLKSQSSYREKVPHDPKMEKVYRKYLPKTGLSIRARTYIQEKLEGCESDYDKLRTLEALLSGMEYSLQPGDLPRNVKDGATFVDDLLFRSRKGYCSHYASAFVIIARSLGIPARYVQGYCIEGKSGGSVIVTSNEAHAWAEAYVEGFGWLSFEPTPGKKVISAWEDADENVKGEVFDPTVYYAKGGQKRHGKSGKKLPSQKPTKKQVTPWVGWSATVALGLVLVLSVCMVLGNLFAKWQFLHLPQQEQYRKLCRNNLRILHILGFTMEEGETLQEFYLRCGEKLQAKEVEFLQGMQSFYYGRGDDVPGKEAAEDCMNCLYQRLYDEKGRWKYVYWKYIRG